MNPPPPIFPAAGSTTASANATATAASTALPPRFRISTPAFEPNASSVATIALAPRTAPRGHAFASPTRVRYSAAACARVTCAVMENTDTVRPTAHTDDAICRLIAAKRHYVIKFPSSRQAAQPRAPLIERKCHVFELAVSQ